MEDMYLDLSGMEQDFPDDFWKDLWDLSLNGILVAAAEESDFSPIPWDAGVSVKDGKIIISGGVDCGGYGTCVVTLPQNQKHYRFYVEPRNGKTAALKAKFEAVGVRVLYQDEE